MSLEKLRLVVEQIVLRAPQVRGRGEQATRQAMILPMLESLGYDIWNPAEVAPEFESDTAIRKAGQKEKVDYALVLSDMPRIFIEVKPLGEGLDGHEGQLARYFNSTPSVSLAVLTDGLEYRFFTDTGEPNIQDPAPFFVTRLDAVDPQFDVLMRFHKVRFDAAAIRDFATELKYAAVFEDYLRGQLDLRSREPSEEFVRWVLTQTDAWAGRTTGAVVERFRPVVKRSLVRVLRDIVRRSVAALDDEVARGPDEPTPGGAGPQPSAPDAKEPETGRTDASSEVAIITTDRELACFEIVRSIFATIPVSERRYYDAAKRKTVDAELSFKDTTGYFGIYVNKPSNWVMRLVVETKNPWVGFSEACAPIASSSTVEFERLAPAAFAPIRFAIGAPEDLERLRELIRKALLAAMSTGAS